MTTHELIYGPTGSGKTRLTRERLAADIADELVETWVVDPFLGLAEYAKKVDRYVRHSGDIDDLVAALLCEAYVRAEEMAALSLTDFTSDDPRHDRRLIVVTVDAADDVLRNLRRARIVEQTMRMSRRAGIEFRLVVTEPLLGALGCSEVIRSTMTGGTVFACEKDAVAS